MERRGLGGRDEIVTHTTCRSGRDTCRRLDGLACDANASGRLIFRRDWLDSLTDVERKTPEQAQECASLKGRQGSPQLLAHFTREPFGSDAN